MSTISRGFHGKRPATDPSRIPPGQHLVRDFPVLSAGPTPHTALSDWSFTIRGAVETPVSWTWEQFIALPTDDVTVDIHCVTKWSKLDTAWTGVSVDTLLGHVDTTAKFVMAYSDGGYTTNVPIADVTGGKAWVAFDYDGGPLPPEHLPELVAQVVGACTDAREGVHDRGGDPIRDRVPQPAGRERDRPFARATFARAAREYASAHVLTRAKRYTPAIEKITFGIQAARYGGISPLAPTAFVSWIIIRKRTVVARLIAMP